MIYDEVMKSKRVADVELHFKSGLVRQGIFYVNIRQRPLEVLNDDRKFIPFRDEDGSVMIISKDVIAMVRPLGDSRLETAGNGALATAPPPAEPVDGDEFTDDF